MIEIMFNEIEKMYGGRKVLQGATFSVLSGERVGLVGGNGAGKTTLLKIMAGLETCDGGNLSIRKGASLGYLDQLPEIPANSKVIDVLHMAFAEQFELFRSMRELAKQMETLRGDGPEYRTLLHKYGNLQELYEQKEGFGIDQKVEKVCQGLKISVPFLSREFRTLSGGEKTRVILGRILLESPDILLLDEPTNHLDLESIEWLEDFMAKYKGAVVVVSHDRYFLDKAVTKIIEVENGRTETYNTGYSGFCREKEKRTQELLKKYNQQENEIKRLEKAAHNLREWGKIADNPDLHKRAENIEKRIEKMDKVEKPALGENSFPLAFTNSESRSTDVIRAENLGKSFGEKTLFAHLNLHIRFREKAALIGPNGTGKSTLLKILLNEYGPDSGEVVIGPGTKPAYIEQTVAFAGRDNTVLEEFRNNNQVTEGQARRVLAKFSFKGEEVFKKVQNLSGGEKSRLRLCLLMQRDVNFLILDEPTNHLDIHSREVLEKALLEFDGTILFTSHDRYFINRIAGRIMELKNGELRSYPGNYEYFKEKKAQEQVQAVRAGKARPPKREKRGLNMTTGPETNREKRHSDIENEISRLELRIKEKTREMDGCNSDFSRLSELYQERSALEKELDSLMEDWLSD